MFLLTNARVPHDDPLKTSAVMLVVGSARTPGPVAPFDTPYRLSPGRLAGHGMPDPHCGPESGAIFSM